jgi:hypothetical protein
MNDAAAAAPSSLWTPGLILGNGLAFAANMLALCGVWAWNWDAFQLLILYWCETGIAAFWALMTLWLLPQPMLGTMSVNGKVVPATNRMLLEMFAMVFGVFLTIHLVLLWVFFSAGSAAAVHGPASFVRELVFASAAWLPLLFAFGSGFMDFLQAPKRESFALRIERLLYPARQPIARNNDGKTDGVGSVIALPLIRIVLMQVAVIFGAMLGRRYGSDVPFYILIGLKTLADIRRPDAAKRSA